MRGMTWDHARGYDPLAAASARWASLTGVQIEWDRRSLQDFETYSVEVLAAQYDLIVIDHPHVGQVAQKNCLLPLEGYLSLLEAAELTRGSVGQSFDSYNWHGHQWALPIDAATQVQAWAPDRIAAPVATWAQLAPLVKAGRVLCPLRAPHSLMSLFTLSGQNGIVLPVEGPDLFPTEVAKGYDQLLELAQALDPCCYDMDPIAVLEEMGAVESEIIVSPLIYGYVSYSLASFRPRRVAFTDLADVGFGLKGSALGGTGIAVSAQSKTPQQAVDFAKWVASGPIQRDLYALSGGQAGHAVAWEADSVTALVADFYAATRATLEGAWVRPRHNGYMTFQSEASARLNQGLKRGEEAVSVLAALNALFRESL